MLNLPQICDRDRSLFFNIVWSRSTPADHRGFLISLQTTFCCQLQPCSWLPHAVSLIATTLFLASPRSHNLVVGFHDHHRYANLFWNVVTAVHVFLATKKLQNMREGATVPSSQRYTQNQRWSQNRHSYPPHNCDDLGSKNHPPASVQVPQPWRSDTMIKMAMFVLK